MKIILFINIIFLPTILNYLNDSEGGAIIILCDFSAPQCTPPTIPKYFTILMTEVRDAIIFVEFWRPSMPPPPSPDAIILNYLNNRERGRHIFCKILAPLQCPPDATILNYLTDREEGRALYFVGFCPPPPQMSILNDLNDREWAPLSCEKLNT